MSASLLRQLVAVFLMMGLSSCATRPPSMPTTGRFESRQIELDGTVHAYQVFVPASAHIGKRPVILFLHGSGERGSDNQAQLKAGIGPYLRQHLDDFPAIVVLPQAPANEEWKDANLRAAVAALEAATREFGGDPDRTYLTGLSMGGYGSWGLALAEPKRFAAIVPICGGLVHPARPSMNVSAFAGAADPYDVVARQLKHVPIWIFHGAKDDVVLPENSRRMAAALKVVGARDARYTEFADANHNAWDPAYATPALWEWLFLQRRK